MASCCQTRNTNVACEGETVAERDGSVRALRPRIDIRETPTELVVLADLPGVKREHVEIEYDDGVLSLRATALPRQDERARYLVREYGAGDFVRRFRLGETIDPAGISAEMHDGVLRLRLPKVAKARARKIQVSSN